MIELELKEYKYKDLCTILGEQPKRSNSKKSQLKRWSSIFSWENPTTHTFKITEIYDTPKEKLDGRKNNGGYRCGSGRKLKAQEEFDYLLNSFLHREFSRNSYNGRSTLCSARFNNSTISKYFGLYCDWFYDAKKDGKVDKNVFNNIARKLAEKRRSLILNKMGRVENIFIGHGIIAYKDKSHKEFDYKDEYIENYNKYQDKYIKSKRLKSIKDVIDNELWLDMENFISFHFNDYEHIEKCHKIDFSINNLKEYDIEEYCKYKKRFNNIIVDDLRNYFLKKEVNVDEYNYVIDKYIALPIVDT